jgi:hypothetical protein
LVNLCICAGSFLVSVRKVGNHIRMAMVVWWSGSIFRCDHSAFLANITALQHAFLKPVPVTRA